MKKPNHCIMYVYLRRDWLETPANITIEHRLLRLTEKRLTNYRAHGV